MGNYPWTNDACRQILALQKQLSKTTDIHVEYAIQETLNSLIEKTVREEALNDRQIQNMKRDRWRKEHKRRVTDTDIEALKGNPPIQDENIFIFEIQRQLSPQSFDLLLRKASGYSYAELSQTAQGVSASTLKKRVNRIRKKLAPLAA